MIRKERNEKSGGEDESVDADVARHIVSRDEAHAPFGPTERSLALAKGDDQIFLFG